MARNPKTAVVGVRMSPSLRAGLKEAADDEGCSLNAYIVQVLAAAAGHRARFRGSAETGPMPGERRDDLRRMPRRNGGKPVDWKEHDRHLAARNDFHKAALQEYGSETAVQMTNFVDFTCPWHYVEWKELDGPLWPENFACRESSASRMTLGDPGR